MSAREGPFEPTDRCRDPPGGGPVNSLQHGSSDVALVNSNVTLPPRLVTLLLRRVPLVPGGIALLQCDGKSLPCVFRFEPCVLRLELRVLRLSLSGIALRLQVTASFGFSLRRLALDVRLGYGRGEDLEAL